MLLHNPTAGGAHPSAVELMEQLRAAGFSPRYQSTKDDSYREALNQDWDLVIVAGGDGTVTRVARGLRDRTTPIAILPIGTANNIARALGLEGDVAGLIARLGTAKPRRLDVGVAEGPWGKRRFLEAVGFGAIAKAISHSGHPSRPKLFASIPAGRSCKNSCRMRRRNASNSALMASGLLGIFCCLRCST